MEKPFLCWAYDETVVEGHTYRYQVLYALRSPVYDSNITRPPALAEQFCDLERNQPRRLGPVDRRCPSRPPSSTSTPPTGPQTVTPAAIKINVFKWAQGKWQTLPFNVSPGDKIGDLQAGVDYGTNVTVVDLKYDPRGNNGAGRPYVLLLTADGRLIEREPTADRTNERMLSLQAYIQSITPPPARSRERPVLRERRGPLALRAHRQCRGRARLRVVFDRATTLPPAAAGRSRDRVSRW